MLKHFVKKKISFISFHLSIFYFIFSFIFSLLFHLVSSSLVLSCLSFCLLSLSLCLRVLLWWWLLCPGVVCCCVCVRAVWCGTLKNPVCTFKTSPRVVTLAGVVPVHTGTF